MDYAAWLEHIFSAPPDLRSAPAAAALAATVTPARAIRLITRIFTHCGRDLARFTDRQVADGLAFIGSAGESDWMRFLYDPHVPWVSRLAGIHSIATLYRDCFARRCLTGDRVAIGRPETDPLNIVCFMWWDRFPGPPPGTSDEDEAVVDRELIGVMAAALELPHDACRYSALHGLGHWQPAHPLRVRAIIDGWLVRTPGLPEGLVKYAREAREGHVM